MDDTITFLGNFPHGCKYAPALSCKRVNNNSHHTTDNSQDYISKIYNSEDDMRREFKKYTTFFPNPISANNSKNNNNSNILVDRVDFVTEIKPPCSADISNLSEESQKVLQQCQGITQERLQNASLKQLRVKYGTKVLVLYAKEALFWSYFVYMKSLFKGLKYLERHNIVHPEIMPINIVLDERHKRFLLSEFMLTQHAENFYKPNYRENLVKVDYYSPPEHIYAYFMLSPSGESYENTMKKQLFKNEDFDARIQRLKIAMDSYFTSIRNTRALDIYMRWIDKLKYLRQMDIENFVNEIRTRVESNTDNKTTVRQKLEVQLEVELEVLATKANVYTLGATLLECLIIAFDQFRQRNLNVIEWSASTENLYNRVLILILRMMRANPYVRVDASEAFKNYENIAKDVRKLYQGVTNAKHTTAPRQNRLTRIIKGVGQHLLNHGPKYVAVALAVYAAQRFKGRKGMKGIEDIESVTQSATQSAQAKSEAQKIVDTILNSHKKTASNSFTRVKKFAGDRVKDVTQLKSEAQKLVNNIPSSHKKTASNSFTRVKDFAGDRVKDVMQVKPAHPLLTVKRIPNSAKKNADNFLTGVKKVVDDGVTRGKNFVDGIPNNTKKKASNTLKGVQKFAGDKVNSGKKKASEGLSEASDWFETRLLPLEQRIIKENHKKAIKKLQDRKKELQYKISKNLDLQEKYKKQKEETRQQNKDFKHMTKEQERQVKKAQKEMRKQEERTRKQEAQMKKEQEKAANELKRLEAQTKKLKSAGV